jgi:hypothetical protein
LQKATHQTKIKANKVPKTRKSKQIMNKSSQNKKVKVQITYEWEFDIKDWMDLNAHEEKVKEIMKQNFEWDAVNAFYNLRNITYPRVKGINIE